jgi:hypothetical protein
MMTHGMVSRYFVEEGRGTLVLSDGTIKEFTKENWVDKDYAYPSMAQKILYTEDQSGIKIRTISEDELKQLKNNTLEIEESPSQEESPIQKFMSLEECKDFYLALGFKIATDRKKDNIQTISMRFYEDGEFGEAIITCDGKNIKIKETRNGKPV